MSINNLKGASNAGRDLWFSMITNYISGGGKYYMLYVTSLKDTKIKIAIGRGAPATFNIDAEEVVSYKIPLTWELSGSATIEDKAIHVWSEDADIVGYLLSRNPFSSDGMYIIPEIGWGTEYVVAAYHSWCCGSGNDLPSEFAVIASQDSTVITVNPTTDVRAGLNGNAQFAETGTPFTMTLMRGQAVQFLAMFNDTAKTGFDFTGTTVSSNKPVGVVGGSMCANIPVDFPYCDHVCDMIPPVRTWGQTYYTAPFASRKGGDTYLVVASKDQQTIKRTTATGQEQLHAVLDKNEPYFRHDITEASVWRSDAPFMLVQYINSTTFPGNGQSNDGIGDPSMVVVNPNDQFSNSTVFQTPTIQGGQSAFQNFVNIVVHKNAENNTYFDGTKIASAPGATYLPVDDNYKVYRFRSVSPGTHVVTSDSGVGVYVYGYGAYDSYTWSANLGIRSTNSSDTSAPMFVEAVSECDESRTTVSDTHPGSSLLSSVMLDSAINMQFESLTDAWPAEIWQYDVTPINPSLNGFAHVLARDLAGNRLRITHMYTPAGVSLSTTSQQLVSEVGKDTTFEVVFTNTSESRITGLESILLKGDQGFEVVEGIPSSLDAGMSATIRLRFKPLTAIDAIDTLRVGNSCITRTVSLNGSIDGSTVVQEFRVDSAEFGKVFVGLNRTQAIEIINLANAPVTIVEASKMSAGDFELQVSLPLTVPASSSVSIPVTFAPTKPGVQSMLVQIGSGEGKNRISLLTGEGVLNSSVASGSSPEPRLFLRPNPVHGDLKSIELEVSDDVIAVKQITVYNNLGQVLLSLNAPVGEREIALDIAQFSSGRYIIEAAFEDGTSDRLPLTIAR